jgi:ATP-dependent RNA/DNA helicase IGHMBP2
MILGVAITNKTTKALTGIDRDYAPVCADLAHGWTLCPRNELASRPARLRIIGRRYAYEAQLSGYCLPDGLCSCQRSPCRCQGVQLKGGDRPGVLLLIHATPRESWDGTEEDVLRYPRYYERFNRDTQPLDPAMLALLTERWHRTHAKHAARDGGPLARWKQLNRIRAFVAHERGALVALAKQPWDTERFAEGQLVLLTESPVATASAETNFVYRLPNLDVALRVEDTGLQELIVDCGEQDLVRVEQYLRSQNGRPLRLTLDTEETDRQIERERRTLREAETDERLRELIGDPTLARSTPAREPVEFFNATLDPGQQAVVRAALAADDLLVVQGPPGTGKTTAICEILRQCLARDPYAQILLAAQTHQAVDNVLLRLAEADPDLPIARVASVHTVDRVDEHIRARYWTEATEPWHPPIVRRAYSYRHFIDAQIRAGDRGTDQVTSRMLAIQEDYLASIGPQRTPSERLAQARVIAGTCAGVQGNPALRAMRFPVAILEEAGKATPPEALMLTLRARKSILVGDSRQLPPHTWNPVRTVLHKPHTLTTGNTHHADEAKLIRASIEALGATPEERVAADQETLFDHFAEHLHGTPHEATLSTQYRMLAPIGELVSQVFYGDIGGLHHRRETPIDPRVAAFAGDVRVRLVDLPGKEQHEGRSALRLPEVDHVRRELRALNEQAAEVGLPTDGPELLQVAVITPYTAQARRLTARLDLTRYPALNVRIGIVDRFQGDEAQVVFLSMAATTAAGFLKIPNRINVAVSRAQDLLVITTDLKRALAGRIGAPFANVARFISEREEQGDRAYQIVKPAR